MVTRGPDVGLVPKRATIMRCFRGNSRRDRIVRSLHRTNPWLNSTVDQRTSIRSKQITCWCSDPTTTRTCIGDGNPSPTAGTEARHASRRSGASRLHAKRSCCSLIDKRPWRQCQFDQSHTSAELKCGLPHRGGMCQRERSNCSAQDIPETGLMTRPGCPGSRAGTEGGLRQEPRAHISSTHLQRAAEDAYHFVVPDHFHTVPHQQVDEFPFPLRWNGHVVAVEHRGTDICVSCLD